MRNMKRPMKPVRFDTLTQVEKIVRAAKRRKWSFNRFVVEASSELAEQILTTEKNGNPLTVESNPLSLNQ